jgi:hypothetical protein
LANPSFERTVSARRCLPLNSNVERLLSGSELVARDFCFCLGLSDICPSRKTDARVTPA